MDCNVGFKEANKDKAIVADLYYERAILNNLSGALTKLRNVNGWESIGQASVKTSKGLRSQVGASLRNHCFYISNITTNPNPIMPIMR